MKPIKKLQELIAKIRDDEAKEQEQQEEEHNETNNANTSDDTDQDQDTKSDNDGTDHNSQDNEQAIRHLSPVSYRIKEWLDGKSWHYMHEKPDDDDDNEHFFVMGFGGNDFSWHCVIRVQEGNKLVSMQGIIHEDIAPDYFASIMAEFSRINANISIGNVNLEPRTTTIYTKVGFDAEFTLMTERMLDSFMHMLFGLTQKANDVIQNMLENPNPNPNIAHILKEHQANLKKQQEQDGDEVFFLIDDGVQ